MKHNISKNGNEITLTVTLNKKEMKAEENIAFGYRKARQYLIDKGFNVYSVSLGPVSSTYDCAIETFYQIKGGQVNYGDQHSKKYNLVQKPKEKYYPGLYPEWDEWTNS